MGGLDKTWMSTGHFSVVCLVTFAINGIEATDDLAHIQSYMYMSRVIKQTVAVWLLGKVQTMANNLKGIPHS